MSHYEIEHPRTGDGKFAIKAQPEAEVSLVDLDVSLTDSSYDECFRGSGWGAHRPTAPATEIPDVRVGDVLAEHCEQFNARNLVRVTSVDTDRGILHGHYADIEDTTQLRTGTDRDIAVWDFQLAKGEHSFTDVRG